MMQICKELNKALEDICLRYHRPIPKPDAPVNGVIMIQFLENSKHAVTMIGTISIGPAIGSLMESYINDQIKHRGELIPIA